MRHEKIIKREDGSKIKITVSLYVDEKVYWSTGTYICLPGKRKFNNVLTGNLYHMPLSEEERLKYFSQYATTEEINVVKLELWEKLKP